MTTSSALLGLLGGFLIGAASLWAYFATKKVPGISGVYARILNGKKGDTSWRIFMIAGLIVGAGLTFTLIPQTREFESIDSPVRLVVAGLLVGIGTRIGGGCTSGHGVCGMGQWVRDSVVATLIFMVAAMATVWVSSIVTGGSQ